MKPAFALLIFSLLTTACTLRPVVVSEGGTAEVEAPFETMELERLVANVKPASAARGPSAETAWAEGLPGEVFPAVTDAQVLLRLDQSGVSFQDVIDQAPSGSANNALLTEKNPLYRDFVDFAKEDVAASFTRENSYRPDWGPVAVSVNAKRKGFDVSWLSSPYSHYELVGVINRIDRMVFAPETCGEFRLIYRLAYVKPKVRSRLPLTVNVVYYLPKPKDQNCASLLGEWRAPNDLSASGFAAWLRSEGPLKPERLSFKNLKAIETNYQVIRSASGIRNLLGGSAEYILRVFHLDPEKQRLVRATLENTPDVARLKHDAKLRSQLLEFLKEPANFAKLDQGTLRLPEKFLTTSASSYSPHGIARMENRIFDRVYSESDFGDVDFSKRKYVKTPSAALRRLNDLSCVGCHQNRTIAGFHLLGEDRDGTYPLNSIFAGGSGHFRAELERRRGYLDDLAKGMKPSEDRPFSIAPSGDRAKYGDFCGLPGAKSFDEWICETGLTCQLIDGAEGENEVGKCFPPLRLSGDPCLKNFVTQDLHALDKMIQPWETQECGDKTHPGYECRLPGAGFPSAMCTADCNEITDQNREICGPIDGPGFSDCITDKDKTFNECMDKTHATSARGRCNAERSCRNDYVCIKTDEADGACVPSYFLFQIRVDGHPSPKPAH